MLELDQDTNIYSVSELNHEAKQLLEGEFPSIWVEGEVSNFACPASGHWYFSLKDDNAQVRCAMFRGFNRLLNFKPETGTRVLIRAKVSLYQGRGDFQLIANYMEEAGFGALQRAFEALKKKLEQEGLFNPIHKQSIPTIPQQIGVITSATGAAIRDIISTLKRRFPSIPIIIYPTAVQGKEAAPQIVRAIELANQRQECDVLILARGGGSLEDLWPFNEEIVARAIYASKLPIVSGVGHEVDITIADFVADHRAATPTAAAELCCPHVSDWLNALQQLENRLLRTIQHQLQHWQQLVQWLQKRLKHPGQRLNELAQRIDTLEHKLITTISHQLRIKHHQIAHLGQQILRYHPQHKLAQYQHNLSLKQQQLINSMQQKLAQLKHQLVTLTSALDSISPLATLSRGYAIVSKTADGQIIRQSSDVKIGEKITTKLAKGELYCYVDDISEQP